MAEGLLGSELQSLNQDISLRLNDSELRKAIAAIYSRGGLARSTKTHTEGGTINARIGIHIINPAVSNILLELPYANYWGDGKGPLICCMNVSATYFATLTMVGSNTINGASTYDIKPKEVVILMSDGGSQWVALAGKTMTGGILLKDYIDFTAIAEPSNPAADTLRLWAEDRGGFEGLHFKDSTGLDYQLGRDNIITVRNNTGATLSKGKAVYINGSTGVYPTVALAKADSAATMPAMGLVVADIADASFGQIMLAGDLRNVDTSAFVDGAVLYVSAATAGEISATRATGTSQDQRVGVVVKSSAGAGIIAVLIGGEFDPSTTQTLTNKTLTAPNISQVVFPATQVASADANTLDDYEEGTFTPALKFGGASTGMTYGIQTGAYTKVGRKVSWTIRLQLSAKGSSTGTATITDWPFNSAYGAAMSVGYYNGLDAGITSPPHGFHSGGTLFLYKSAAASGAAMADTDFAATSDVILDGVYFV